MAVLAGTIPITEIVLLFRFTLPARVRTLSRVAALIAGPVTLDPTALGWNVTHVMSAGSVIRICSTERQRHTAPRPADRKEWLQRPQRP